MSLLLAPEAIAQAPAAAPIPPSVSLPAIDPLPDLPVTPPDPDDSAEIAPDRPAPGPLLEGLRTPDEMLVVPPGTLMLLPPDAFRTPVDLPNGFAGKSSIIPREAQETADFVPVEDRWRVGFPAWDRYGKGKGSLEDIPYTVGRWYDPYNQNLLKGDFPIIGQHTFLDVTATNLMVSEFRRAPTQTGAFESTARAGQFPFFGRPNQFGFSNFSQVSFNLFHGDTAFKPVDWQIKVTPVFNVNSAAFSELAQVSPNVLQGTSRNRTFFALQEYFAEGKLTDLSPNFDFASVRVGSQFFVSDFRGLIFADVNRAVRLFGTRNGNRDQFNLAYFRQAEKDTNSGLNSFYDRNQNVVIANYYRQDFIWPGYTSQLSFHFNNDNPYFRFSKNRTLVRPDPVGIFQTHRVDVAYLGWTGDGHINRFNVNHALYWAFGRDSMNPLAGKPQNISAMLGAIELSYDRDWMRFRTAFLYASGDKDINNNKATGFDSILDSQVFAGGIFATLQRQALPLFGVNLVNNGSLLPDLRASKIQGQSNFVNPGLILFNLGQDMDLTPKLKMINNMNFEWFDSTNVLEQYLYMGNIHRGIGVDISSGFEYRPFLSDNFVCVLGVTTLLPGLGFRNLYSNFGEQVDPLFAGFTAMTVSF
ncbi:hypothetical protein EP7_004993 [Isosphaeraceae bacterium EP7]